MTKSPEPLESGADPTPEDAGSHVKEETTGVYETEPQGPDRIAQRAYERFQSRGGEHRRHEEDWLEAERELNRSDRE